MSSLLRRRVALATAPMHRLLAVLFVLTCVFAGCDESQQVDEDKARRAIEEQIRMRKELEAQSNGLIDLLPSERNDYFIKIARDAGALLDFSSPESCFHELKLALRDNDWTTAHAYLYDQQRISCFEDAISSLRAGMLASDEPDARRKLDTFFEDTIGVDLRFVENRFTDKYEVATCFLELSDHGSAMEELIKYGNENFPNRFNGNWYMQKLSRAHLDKLSYHGLVVSSVVYFDNDPYTEYPVNFGKWNDAWLFNFVAFD
ncbi:MAG: hypothetical protein AAF456_04140 [Planctomycetota bacterium]